MASIKSALILGALAATGFASSASAGSRPATAPTGTADTRYCMRVTATGSVAEPTLCWTRDGWAAQGVDVDRDWPREGVRVIG